ncbi:uncharacterized protein Dvir_GJ25947, isoform B [Drosophila virilis]|nr:uncharacterized protein Dvir_GJ25947, isoform B [Drosophila virilis]
MADDKMRLNVVVSRNWSHCTTTNGLNWIATMMDEEYWQVLLLASSSVLSRLSGTRPQPRRGSNGVPDCAKGVPEVWRRILQKA